MKPIMPCESNLSSAPRASSKKEITTRKLEITAISAMDLVDGGKPLKKNAFVAFEIAGNYWKRPMRTSVDEVGGNKPMWNETLETEFTTETEEGFMYVMVFCTNSGNKDKHVGTARVPIKVFTGEYAPEGFLHCLSYRLWDDYGRRNGIVNFSARITPNKSDHKGGVLPFWLNKN